MLSIFAGINPKAKIFDNQHGIIYAGKSDYFIEHKGTHPITLERKGGPCDWMIETLCLESLTQILGPLEFRELNIIPLLSFIVPSPLAGIQIVIVEK